MVPQTPVAAKTGNLTAVLPIIAKDFQAIRVGFTKLVQLKKQEGASRSSDVSRQRQLAYKEKFSKVKVEKIDPKKKSLEEHTKGFFSTLKSISGVLGGIFLVLGAAGIAKMIFSSDAGKFLGKFLTAIFTGLIDFAKGAINVVKSIFQDSDVKKAFFKTIGSIFKFIGTALITGFSIFKSLLTDGEVISKIVDTIKSVFSAIFDSLGALVDIVSEILNSNLGIVKDGVVKFFTKIIDVIVPTLSIIAGSFASLAQDERFSNAIKSIGSNLAQLLVDAWNIEYTEKDGSKRSIARNILETLGEAAILYAAMMKFKLEMLKLGIAIGAANFSKPGECDCGPVGPEDISDVDKEKRRRPGSYQEKGKSVGRDRLEQIKRARETAEAGSKSQSWWQRAKNSVGGAWEGLSNKAKGVLASMEKGFDSAKKYIQSYAEKVARTVRAMISNTKIQSKVMTAFAKRFGSAAASRLSAFFVAQGAALAAAPISGGISIVVNILMLGLAAYDIYSLYHLLFVSSDGENEDGGLIKELQADIDAFEKQETGGIVTEPPSPTPTPPLPNQAQLNQEGSKIGAGYAAATYTPTPAPAMAAAPASSATPTQSSTMSVASDVSKAQVIGAGTAEATAALKAKMKQGDVIAEQHEAGTDILAQNIPGLIPGFNRFTAFDDAFHNKVSPGSKHASGLAIDFTINGGSAEYARAASAIKKHLLDSGLNMSEFVVIDELNNPSSKATGPHIHVQFQSKEAAAKYRGLYPNMALTAFAKDAVSAEGTPYNMPAATNNAIQQAEKQQEEKQTFASLMFGDLTKGMAALDQMTGGKLGLMSDEMRVAMRGLEDEANKGGSFFDMSSTVIANKIENKGVGQASIQRTNENILSTLLNRQYA